MAYLQRMPRTLKEYHDNLCSFSRALDQSSIASLGLQQVPLDGGNALWTRGTHRALGMEELHYFKVFGDSIVSKVSRVHWMATEKSKFNFVSSVSHEFRLPLHGILASAELLHATALQPAQEEMVKMIETSGLTLLDTTDHL